MSVLNVNITTGGTSQQILAAGNNILNACLVATTEDGWLNFGSNASWASTGVDTATDLITTSSPHGLTNRQAVTVTTAGTLPTGISAATVYYLIVPSVTTFGFATTDVNAQAGTLINLTAAGTGASTVVVQAAENVGIPYFLNTPLFLNAAEYPDITKAWNVYSANTNSKIAVLFTPIGA